MLKLSHQWKIESLISLIESYSNPQDHYSHGHLELKLFVPLNQRKWEECRSLSEHEFMQLGGVNYFKNTPDDMKPILSEVAAPFSQLNLHLFRPRLLAIGPGTSQDIHIDRKSNVPLWRLHIPLLTHEESFLDFFDHEQRLLKTLSVTADGSGYLMNITEYHRARSTSDKKWRIHFVADLLESISTEQISKLL